jgi:hypothetical protein
MLVGIVIGLVIIVVLFAVIVALSPDGFRVTRSITIPASLVAIFPHVNDLHKWEAWSPWERMDPGMKKTFEGPASGTGAGYSWTGNKKVGAGRMTIAESRENELVRINLEFLKPFKATSTAEFTFKPGEKQTKVTWSTFGKNNFMAKVFWLVVDVDKMMGDEFEKGLANLKTVCAAPPER